MKNTKEESWVERWRTCTKCDEITPHVPYLQNWGKASPKCKYCGNVNLFSDFENINCEIKKLYEKS